MAVRACVWNADGGLQSDVATGFPPPGSPLTFDLFDRLGVLSWDENRDYGRYQAGDMADMVKRDRNHPAIIIWSVCNEIECQEATRAQGDVRCFWARFPPV